MSEPTGLYDDDELIELSEEIEHAHDRYLAEFVEKVFPVFERRGFTKDTALLFWVLNKVENVLNDIRDEKSW